LEWLPLFTVFFGTGGRVGEITGLTWNDCDFERNIISINHTLSYFCLDGEKKNFM
jgi:integrase